MYHKCTTEKSAAQQRQMEQTLLQMLGQMPYSQITVSALCKQAGLSRKVFYRLFTGKDSALYALVDHTIMGYIHYHPEQTETPEEGLAHFFAFWRSNRSLLDALEENGKINLLLERELAQTFTERSTVREFFGLQGHPFARELVLFYMSGIMALVVEWYKQGFAQSEAYMAQVLTQALTKSLTEHRSV